MKSIKELFNNSAFAVLLMLIWMVGIAWAADTKISGLTEDTAPTSDDLVITVDAPGGTPANKKVTLGNLSKGLTGVNETYGSGWDSDTGVPEKDDIYDYLHQLDSDDDGSIGDETINISGTWEVQDNIDYSFGNDANFKFRLDTTFSTSDEVPLLYFGESNGGTGASDVIPILNIGDATMAALTTDTSNLNATEPGLRLWNDTADSWSLWGANDDGPQITIGGNATGFSIPNLVAGTSAITEDSGAVKLVDMSVSATPAAGTEESYSFEVDDVTILTVYAEADNAGSVQNTGVRFRGNTPAFSADTDTITASELMAPVITNAGWDGADNQTLTFAAGVGGEKFTFIVHSPETATANVILNPNDANIIILDGTVLDAGDSVAITDPAQGAAISMTFVNVGGTVYIYAYTVAGIWADNG